MSSVRTGRIFVAALAAVGVGASAVAVSASSKLPTTITAAMVPADKAPFLTPGTVVSQKRLGNRVFVSQQKGFALANVIIRRNGIGGLTYPVVTVNGGKTWKVAGGHLHINAANAPNVVTAVGADHSAYFAYGGPGGGQSIVVSTNAGGTWFRAFMPDTPVAVASGPGPSGHRTLFAFVATKHISEYTSTDGGRHWHLH